MLRLAATTDLAAPALQATTKSLLRLKQAFVFWRV
jgi:hypothetical protein